MELSHHNERSDSALDSLEHELYNPRNKMDDVTLHHVRNKREVELPTSWGDNSPLIIEGKEEKGVSFGLKLLMLSISILVIALGFTAWRVVSLRNVVSNANIDMTLNINPYTEGGETAPLTFTLYNRNTSVLQDASISLVYKQGVGSQDEQEKVHEKRELGTINPNENKREDFNVILYGSEAEERNLVVKLEYKVAGSNAVFNKIITTSTILKTPPISVSIDGPNLLSIGQTGTFTITVKNNSATTSLQNVLALTLPNTFVISNTEPKQNGRGNVWTIAPLATGESTKIIITGSVSGVQGETTTMKAMVGGRGDSPTSIGVVFSSQTYDIKLRTSPLTFGMTLDTDSASEKIRYGDRATIAVVYENTSDITLHDVNITMYITGDAFQLKKIDPTNGYFDSVKQTITWNRDTIPELANLPPKSSGTFRAIIPIVLSGVNSPKLKVTVEGVATSQLKDDVTTALSKTWAVQGSAVLVTQTTYKNSPLTKFGPIPPNVNVETKYTAHMLVSAQNALVNTKVSFTLPPYVRWADETSNTDTISYNEKLRTVTWSIGELGAEKTTTADIALIVKPSQNHVGFSPAITSGIVMEADEDVSKAHIRTTNSAITTYISGENWTENPSKVVDK